MRILILSRSANIYSTQKLVEAAKKRGHTVVVINPLLCYMNITSDSPEIHYKQMILKDFDAVIPRIGASITFYGTAVLRQLEIMGVYSLNDSIGIVRSRDKLRAHQISSRKGIGMPITSFAHSPSSTKDLIKLVGGAPLVIKLLEGTQGKGVILAETNKAAESVIDAFRGLDAYFLVQEYIKEAKGNDLRCFVVGDKVVASIMRQAKAGEFRSNLHRGGTAEMANITPEERKLAIHAAKVMGLNVAGVDIIRSARGPLLLEINSSPGLEGIQTATKIDIADLIIEFIEKNAKPTTGAEKGKG